MRYNFVFELEFIMFLCVSEIFWLILVFIIVYTFHLQRSIFVICHLFEIFEFSSLSLSYFIAPFAFVKRVVWRIGDENIHFNQCVDYWLKNIRFESVQDAGAT